MSEVNVSQIDRQIAREMILEMRGDALNERDELALAACVSNASHTWVCCIDGRPVAAWGLVPPTILADRAYLWLYVTPQIDSHGGMYKFLFVRRAVVIMETMKGLYPHIYGVTSASDKRAQRWIRWLGGEFSPSTVPGMLSFSIETKQLEARSG